MHLSEITPAHLAAVAELERLCFSEPWSESALEVLCRAHGFGVVLPAKGENTSALAYGGMTYALDEASVTNVAVHPDHRRRGLGREIVVALMQRARALGVLYMYLEVRASNAAALVLYRSLGFEVVGSRPRFYRLPTEDALLMRADLGGSPENEKD